MTMTRTQARPCGQCGYELRDHDQYMRCPQEPPYESWGTTFSDSVRVALKIILIAVVLVVLLAWGLDRLYADTQCRMILGTQVCK
jgi:hypothetical protein